MIYITKFYISINNQIKFYIVTALFVNVSYNMSFFEKKNDIKVKAILFCFFAPNSNKKDIKRRGRD
jgi:hypothetical protein